MIGASRSPTGGRGGLRLDGGLGLGLAIALVLVLALPVASLVLSTSGTALRSGLAHPLFWPALGLSLRTTAMSLLLTVLLGTPLAHWLAHAHSRAASTVAFLVDLPIILPPAVVGVALLQTYGRRGLLGPLLSALGVEMAFHTPAVVMAQLVVAAPFYVRAASNAFRKVDWEMLTVARSLGATARQAFMRIALPIAMPGLAVGASLAWARALGEFGATLLFAGNRPGATQTMPLAILSALEADVQLAVVFALVLAAMGAALLLLLHALASPWNRTAATASSREARR